MKIRKLLFVITLVLFLCSNTGCEEDVYYDENITFVNNSDSRVRFYIYKYSFENGSYKMFLTDYTDVEGKGTKNSGITIEGNRKNLYFEIKILKEKRIDNINKDALIRNDIYDSRYFLSCNELKKMNFKITYTDER